MGLPRTRAKGVTTDLIALANNDPRFYGLLGPFLARRGVARELGGRLWDDGGKRWWAVAEDGEAVAFAAAVAGDDVVRLCSAYVVPSRRGRGLHTILVAARLGSYRGIAAEAVCTPAGTRACLSAGFTEVAAKGRFTVVRRSP
jgi:GNAT superfamily N-acetyltransferase